MPDLATTDPGRLLADIALAVMGIGLIVWFLPRQVRLVRRHGGRPLAQLVTGGAVVLLALSLQPELVSAETGLWLTVIGIVLALRPEFAINMTGGPRLEWLALREGGTLQRLVSGRSAEGSDEASDGTDPRVAEHLEALAAAEGPATNRYCELVRATLFENPEAPGRSARLAALAVEEAALRRAIGPKPSFER
jgi:hypothetical protein